MVGNITNNFIEPQPLGCVISQAKACGYLNYNKETLAGGALIELSKSAGENGLANMLFELIRQNIERMPEKINDLQRLNTIVSLSANDSGVSAVLKFADGRLMIEDNTSEIPEIEIITDSETILDLCRIRIMAGLPYYFDNTGRGIIKKLFTGRLKIRGLFAHPIKLTRFTRIMSVV